MGQVNAQGESDNHGVETVVVHQLRNSSLRHQSLGWKEAAVQTEYCKNIFSFGSVASQNSNTPTQWYPFWSQREREKPRSRDHPMGGGGMLDNYQQNSDIMHLFLSFVYNYCKNIQNN